MIRLLRNEVQVPVIDQEEKSLQVKFDYNPEYVRKVKNLARRWYLPDHKAWVVPLAEIDSLIEEFGEDNIKVELEDEDVNNYFKDQGEKKEVKIKERLRNIKPVIDFEFKLKPYPHQIEGFNAGLEKENLLLADEQGLGKTKQSIDIAVARKDRGEVEKCLIICGINSVKYNWEKEVKLHSEEDVVVFDAPAIVDRNENLKNWGKEFFGIINIESLRKDEIIETLKDYISSDIIGMIIVDEIHKAKGGNTAQGKGLRKLNPKYKIGLTGTPIMNDVTDLWNILGWLEVEKMNFWQFRNTYCIMGGYGGYQVVGRKNEADLNRKLNKVMLRRKKDEVLDLPDKIKQIEYVEMSKKQSSLYKKIRWNIIDNIEELEDIPNPLTALLRLRQCTSGVFNDRDAKLMRLKELLEEEVVPNGNKAIIFSNWERVTKSLKSELSEYNPAYITGSVEMKEREKQVEKFYEDDSCKLIIGTIGAMGTGLNLVAGNYVIFMDKAWSPKENEQAEDRAHRIGTEKKVNVISLVVKDSVDERIEEILDEKQEIIDKVVEGKIQKKSRKELLRKLLDIEES